MEDGLHLLYILERINGNKTISISSINSGCIGVHQGVGRSKISTEQIYALTSQSMETVIKKEKDIYYFSA